MRTVILTPYRGDDGPRSRIFDWLLPRIEGLGLPHYVGDSGDEPFSISRTWNHLAAKAGRWDQAIFWAADLWLEDPASSIAAGLETGHHFTRLWTDGVVCNGAETDLILDQGIYPTRHQMPYGGPRIIRRDLWDDLGGSDQRFVGYGFEDYVFNHAVHTLWGPPIRVEGRLYQLHHPKNKTNQADPYMVNREHNRRMCYEFCAITDPDQLRLYLEELR